MYLSFHASDLEEDPGDWTADCVLQEGCNIQLLQVSDGLDLPPAKYVVPQFRGLRDLCPKDGKLMQLVGYINRQWMENTTFPVSSWSAFMRPIRTNNDIEGWHNKLNQVGKPNLNL